ncbi:MAG: alkaline phosphatase family protein [Gemmatimonas sp.]
MNTQTTRRAFDRTLLLIVADGVRHDVLSDEIARGKVPAIADMCNRGAMHQVATCFPSVTGPGYVPFLTGRFPADVGVPGLRWFDRARKVGLWPAYARSYAGIDIWCLDWDLDKKTPTLFELAEPSLATMSMLGRGSRINFGRSLPFMARIARPHFRGDLDGWQAAERVSLQQFLREFERNRPQFATLAVTSADKRAHKEGGESAGVRRAIQDMNDSIAAARAIAERGGWADKLDIWLVGDHGHAPVDRHDDLHGWLEQRGLRVSAHPQVLKRTADVALMVGGNAMAHLYLDPALRTRVFWPALGSKWQSLHDALLQRDAVDLVAISPSEHIVRIASKKLGVAEIRKVGHGDQSRWSYLPINGDPLELGGELAALDSNTAFDACAATQYPDSIVQLSSLMRAPRCGDIVISATRGWDLRSRFEPVAHVSTHGALLREQMTVPLIIDRAVARLPQRTADVFPSALQVLGLPIPEGLDGRTFF